MPRVGEIYGKSGDFRPFGHEPHWRSSCKTRSWTAPGCGDAIRLFVLLFLSTVIIGYYHYYFLVLIPLACTRNILLVSIFS